MPDVSAGNLIVNVMSQTAQFKKGMAEVDKGFAKTSKAIEKSRKAINKAGKVFAGVGLAIGASLLASAKKTADFGDQMNKMSLRTGETAKTLSGLAFAAERSGLDIATLETGLKRAQRVLSDAQSGLETAERPLRQLGISATTSGGQLKTASALLIEFAEKTKDMTDSSKKAALAQEIFGRADTMLLPMLGDGAAGIKALTDEAEKYGVVIDDATAKTGADFVDAMTNFKASIKGVIFLIGNALLQIHSPMSLAFSKSTKNQ